MTDVPADDRSRADEAEYYDDTFVVIEAEREDYDTSPPEFHIVVHPIDFSLETIQNNFNRQQIIIPPFQRRYVWDIKRASRLIESFLTGLPVPPIYLYQERHRAQLTVIDGQQRLRSIVQYFNGVFRGGTGRERPFRLQLSDKSPFHGKQFQELSEDEQNRLQFSVLRAFVVKQIEDNDYESQYHIFERLNTGGVLLSNQEIRQCVYQSRFATLLSTLNNFEYWREIFGKSELDPRRRDEEIVLRILGLGEFLTLAQVTYEKPLKRYLNRFMAETKRWAENAEREDAARKFEQNLQQIEKAFRQACEATVERLGARPFHNERGAFHVPICDAVLSRLYVALRKGRTLPEDLKSRYEKLRSDERFIAATTQATTDEQAVSSRIEIADRILLGDC